MSGRGRGRGRGRGGGGRGGPIVRDDEGQMVFAKKMEGPPPLFPNVETLPERPDITTELNTRLVERRRNLHTFWNESAYYIEPPDQQNSSLPPDIQACLDIKAKPGGGAKRKSLSLYLQLTSAFFPAELLSTQRKKKRVDQQGIWNLKSSDKSDLSRLDKLASLEQKHGERPEKDPEEGDEGSDDDEFRDDRYEEDSDDDDYGRNEGFDDDDEYDFDDGAGEDEGPTF